MVQTNFGHYNKELKVEIESHLWKWIDFIKGKGIEFDFYFNDRSAPYKEEINIILKGHKKCRSCFNLRFNEKGKIVASDSHFRGGTDFAWLGDGKGSETDYVEGLLKQALNKECENSSWNDGCKPNTKFLEQVRKFPGNWRND